MVSWKSISGWLWVGFIVCVPLFHFGPGRVVSKLDTLESLISEARSFEALGQWEGAFQTYSKALNVLDSVLHESRLEINRIRGVRLRLRLAQARSEMLVGRIENAISNLEELLYLQEFPDDLAKLHSEIRATLSHAHYNLGWRIRLEMGDKSGWSTSIEKATDDFQWLSGWALREGDWELVERYRSNLELVTRFSRMKSSDFESLSK